MLKFKKVYIDSSYKVSGTSSDFTIDLPETVQLENNMLCQIHEVSVPHSWYSIQKGVNDRIFVRVEHTGTGAWTTRAMITLTEGDYSVSDLAGHLQVILNNYFNDAEFPPQRSDMFVVSHRNLLNKIRISENYNDIEFQIIPDSDIFTPNGSLMLMKIVLTQSIKFYKIIKLPLMILTHHIIRGLLIYNGLKAYTYIVMKLATLTN